MAIPPATARTAALAAALLIAAARADAAAPTAWDVTVALRVAPTNGGAVSIRLALPPTDARQRLGEVHVATRGLKAEVVTDGPDPHVLLRGKLKGARRVAVSYAVEQLRANATMPPITPLEAPPPDLLPFLTPSPLFQSRSILVRDFLETNVSPLLDAPGPPDLVRSIMQVTRERLPWAKDGKTLTLDVIRSGRGKRIGIERAFTTFLRCARIPARFVEGVDLRSKTSRKRAFWTEAWAQNAWWPMSASSGWVGRPPRGWIALARDGQRVLQAEDTATVTYAVQATAREGGS
ncbi:MAG: transglutaminase-like domain-containing protein [Deltaproteobacteria bacterium]|nr:transglutaminase-like domain-containing protein [Deltaproteobacteria bacterium]